LLDVIGTTLSPLKMGRDYHLVLKEVAGVSGNAPRTETLNFKACKYLEYMLIKHFRLFLSQ